MTLPAEDELARELGASRSTVRRALEWLEAEGLISLGSRGAVLNGRPSTGRPQGAFAIPRTDSRGSTGAGGWLEMTLAPANTLERTRLTLQATDFVYRIRRIRRIDGVPFLLEEAALPAALFPGLDSSGAPLGRLTDLARHYGIELGLAREQVSVASASPSIAADLSVAVGTPLTVLDRVVLARDGRPVEWRMAWLCGAV